MAKATSSDVLLIIASLHGGFNGDVPGQQIGVQILSDTEAVYSLATYVNDAPTGEVTRFALTLEPLSYTPPGNPYGRGPLPTPEETD